jgi:sugar phosphate isomerase/epimerase
MRRFAAGNALSYGYVSSGLSDHRLEHALELLAENGYRGIALTLDHVHFDPFAPRLRVRAARLRAELDAAGLDCVVETGARFVLDPRRKHFPTLLSDGRLRRVDFLCRAVDVASELGAPVVSMWSGAAPPDEPRDLSWDLLVDGCERVLAHAERNGIVLAFEPEPGMLVETLADYEALQERLGHPSSLGLTLDIGHIVCLEPMSVTECVRRGAPTLAHVHIEDMRRGVHEHLMFGDGELDLGEALGVLADVGYGGMVAVELSRHAHAAHEAVPGAMAALRAAQRDVVRT